MSTLRDEDITTTTNTVPAGDADHGDSGSTSADPAGVDPAGTDSGDSDSGDAGGTETEYTIEPRKDDADSSDS